MSTTYIANIVALLVVVLPFLGIQVEEESLGKTLTTLVSIFAGLAVFVGRWRLGDLKWWGGRK